MSALDSNAGSCVAQALLAYQRRHAVMLGQIARQLGVSPSDLSALAALPRPDPRRPDFPTRVRAMASMTGCDSSALQAILVETTA
jgi:hypothetical protein